MGNEMCASHAGGGPLFEFNFAAHDLREEDIPEFKCSLPDSVLSSARCCVPTYLSKDGQEYHEEKSIDLSDNGIESIETNLKEYIRINRQHILTKRDDEIQNIHKSFNTKKLLKV